MSLSVGTIETYSTEFEQTQYSDLSTQGSDSLTLSDSNLWLVDSTTLDGLTMDEFNLSDSTSLYSDGDGYLAPMASTSMESTTGDITVYGSDPNADNILYKGDPTLQTSDGVPLLEIAGDTQSSSSLTSSGGGLNSGRAGGEFTLASSGSTTDGISSSGSLALPNSGGSADSGTTTETTVAGSDLALAANVKDVPFEMHSALSLLIIAAIVVVRRSQGWRRQTITLN